MRQPDVLAALRDVVGDAHVIDTEDERRAAETATFETSQRVTAVVRPADVAQVQECVRVAARFRAPLYPISRGTNWGYGSRVPATSGSVLLDLRRMNRITEFDERLGVLTVEPGVTFRQAHEFLRSHRSRLLLSAIGGSPDSSLIGNVVERGIAKGPYGDRFAHVCNLEVVTGTGALVHTGLGRFERARAAPLHRWGVGPSLDGLFTQSSFGIVTRMSQWLMPRPEHFQILFYDLAREEDVPAVVDALQPLLLSGALRPTLTMYNDYRAISTTQQYPFARAGQRTPLPEDLRRALRAERGPTAGVWGGDVAVHSPSAEHGRLTRKLVERALGNVNAHATVVEADGDEIEGWFAGRDGAAVDATHDASEAAQMRRALMQNFLGIPDDQAIRSVYWRKRAPPPADLDPDRDRCGLLWCTPVVPFVGAEVRAAVRLMEDCLREHELEPGLTIQCISERAVYVVGSISYDRDVPGEDARALSCSKEMTRALIAAGYPPYRMTLASMGEPLAGLARDDTARVTSALRDALDPARVLAPGRYTVQGE